MFYGAPVTAPMEVPFEIPSRFRPEIADTPQLPPAGVDAIRTQGTLAKRKPPVSDVRSENLTYAMSPAAMEAQEIMIGMRNAYGITRDYNRRSRALAKAHARRVDRQLKGSEKQGDRTRRKLQGNTKRRTASTVLRNARDYLGMGTDLYR